MEDFFKEDNVNSDEWRKEEKRMQIHIYAILHLSGYPASIHQRPGCSVTQYNGLTFIFHKDPLHRHDNQTRLKRVKEYQEVLNKKGICLNLFSEDPSDPYLCG